MAAEYARHLVIGTPVAMAKLLLVKHALPQIAPDVVSHRWVLSMEGTRQCDWLASELRDAGVSRLYASLEPKALETAALVAVNLGLDVRPRPGLQENDRSGFGFLPQAELRLRMRRYFDEPAHLVVGTETAQAAQRRFDDAVRSILHEARDETVAVVTHGTVLTSFIAKHNAIEPFDLWSALVTPSYVVLDAATLSFDGTVHNFPSPAV